MMMFEFIEPRVVRDSESVAGQASVRRAERCKECVKGGNLHTQAKLSPNARAPCKEYVKSM